MSCTQEEIDLAAENVQLIVEDLINGIESFDMIKNMTTELAFEESDKDILLIIGLEFESIPFPVNACCFMDNIIDLSREEVQSVIVASKNLNKETNSFQSLLIDCLEIVKKLRLCAYAVISKQFRMMEEERVKREAWNRVVLIYIGMLGKRRHQKSISDLGSTSVRERYRSVHDFVC